MKCAILCTFVIGLLSCETYARTGRTGPIHPFGLNVALTCQRNSIPDTVAPAPRIEFAPGADDEVWLPLGLGDDPKLSFTLPSGNKNWGILDDLLGTAKSPLTSVTKPSPITVNRNEFETLAGRGFPLQSVSRTDFAYPENGTLGFYQLVTVTLGRGGPMDRAIGAPLDSAADAVVDAFSQVGLGTEGCTAGMTFRWTKLPSIYYPNYVLSGGCPRSRMCGFPLETGHSCVPNTESPFHVPVLRYECCWNTVDKWIMRQCGWRQVEIPIVTSCLCRCV